MLYSKVAFLYRSVWCDFKIESLFHCAYCVCVLAGAVAGGFNWIRRKCTTHSVREQKKFIIIRIRRQKTQRTENEKFMTWTENIWKMRNQVICQWAEWVCGISHFGYANGMQATHIELICCNAKWMASSRETYPDRHSPITIGLNRIFFCFLDNPQHAWIRRNWIAHVLFWHESIFRYQTRLTAHRWMKRPAVVFVSFFLKIDQTKRNEMKRTAVA